MATTRVHFTTFGTRQWAIKKLVLQVQARRIGAHSTSSWSLRMLPKSFIDSVSPHIHERRGAGYWLWKPYIVNYELNKLKYGDILVYCDAGCEIDINRQDTFQKYLQLTRSNSFLAFEINQESRQWVNDATIEYFGLDRHSKILRQNQFEAGVLIIRKDKTSSEIVRRWLQIALERPDLFSDRSSFGTKFDGFKEHRHDQSILDLLLKINDISGVLRDQFNPIQTKRTNDADYLSFLLKRIWWKLRGAPERQW